MVGSRRYSTSLRAEQTAVARRRILREAGRLLLERGYPGTTLAGIAEAAGVSVQTIYNVVGGKAALLTAVYESILIGGDEEVAMPDRDFFRRIFEAPDARQCLARYAEVGRILGEQVQPLLSVLMAQAATGDPDLRAFMDGIEAQRATGVTMVVGYLAERFGLRPGLDVRTAADVLWTLTGPEVAGRLVHRRGWSWETYTLWQGTMLADVLLGPEAGPPNR